MKISRILTIYLAVVWFIGQAPCGHAQDALNQLNAENNQGVIEQNDADTTTTSTATTKAINEDKIKATANHKRNLKICQRPSCM